MQASDSRECRNCHALECKIEKGETCIDCHKGLAHHLPDSYQG